MATKAISGKPANLNKRTVYERIGGLDTCRRLSEGFHERIEHDPHLRAMFPKNMDNLSERFAWFLAERLGGPADYTAKRGKQSLICRHAHLAIGAVEGERWLGHMFAVIDDIGIVEPARTWLRDYLTETAHTLSDPFLPYYAIPLEEMRSLLEQNPVLAAESHEGRSLLREAAARWDVARVRMLLDFGANVNVENRLGHDPLYYATNACPPQPEADGRKVVELLVQHGADVNRQSEPGRLTPLHAVARRGTVPIAEALIDAGADIESQDIKGETPLRRAVNCVQLSMVVFLLSRGADPLSADKKGQSPLAAARREDIREALRKAAESQDVSRSP